MSTSRRNFIKSGTMVALAAGIPGGLSKAIQVTGRDMSASSSFALTKSAFEANLNSQFKFRVGGSRTVAMKLAKIADLKRPVGRGAPQKGREGFSLLFEGPSGIKQDTYVIEHEKLGRFSLLVVPVVSRRKPGEHYEVVINRLWS